MNTTARYVIVVFFVIIGLHTLLSVTHEGYGNATSISGLTSKWSAGGSASPPPTYVDEPVPDMYKAPPEDAPLISRRANATLLMLARNSDLDMAVRSMRRLEDRFNRHYRYPWTFLNDVEFSDEFKKRISVLTDAPVEFAVIPKEHWVQPDSIDETKASAARKKMEDENIIYGGSLPYRNMCRFNSGFFFRQKALEKYRWYWRVEPDVHFHCDIKFDPFLFMQDQNKTYGFTITMYEFEKTIPTLWETTKKFIKEHPQYLAENNAMDFLSDNGGEGYNLCHFWSNFEIADMTFWRGPAYTAYFDYLEAAGGFYYERWGDAPVHSIAAALFAPKHQLHFFDEIGYEHNPYTHCPRTQKAWEAGKCGCEQSKSFDYDGYSCMRQWDASVGRG